MADLAKPASAGLQKRVEVDVLSKASPMPSVLRQARVVIQNTPAVQAIFTQARTEGWDATRLAEAVSEAFEPYFPGNHPEVTEAATFLADEFLQLGDAILVISAETGRPIARITDADIYQPAEVPRESGNMVSPGPRLRPELESFVTQWVFDRASEAKISVELSARLPQTQLLREDGDRRVLFSTRAGRQTIGVQIRDLLPKILPVYCGGTPRSLFNFLSIGKPPSDFKGVSLGTCPNYGNASFPLVDGRARNARHDPLAASLATTATGWARGVALHLLLAAKDHPITEMTLDEVKKITKAVQLWVSSANISIALQRLDPSAAVLPLGSGDDIVLGFDKPFGYLDIDEAGYESRTREVFGRWEVVSSFTSTLWVDWSKVRILALRQVPATGSSLEVV